MRIIARNRLPRKAFIWLWGVIWLRLCIPFSLPSPWNLYSMLNTAAGTSTATNGTLHATVLSSWVGVLSGTSSAQAVRKADVMPTVMPQSFSAFPVWTIIWLTGALGCAVFLVINYLFLYRQFRSAQLVTNEFVEEWTTQHRLKRRIQIRQSPYVVSPLTYGIFKPVILMPMTTNWNDHQRLKYILTHEYMHIRRFDSAAKMLVLLHWYNPFVWLMCAQVNRDIEMRCDEAVVRRIGQQRRSDYASTLIHMEERKLAPPSAINYFSKLAIEERVESIMKTKKTTALGILSACLLIGSLTTVLATAPAVASTSAAPVSTTKSVKAYQAGETWKVKGEWEFTVNSIHETSLRANEADGYKPAKQVLIVDYSYKNLRPSSSEPLAFTKANFYLNDAKDANNMADGAHYTLKVPGEDRALDVKPGKSVNHATWVYAFYDQKAGAVQFNVAAYDSHLKIHETQFILPVQKR
ncbi:MULTISPECIES: M56 family metallopeptidase [Paenibacillus]|uniref:M56 family metallopeptidase n=1 Tax=Paenibacillus TaxID=44249 RepID=UPI0021161553|nr:M56 family metallopeptidase [Paenibacillus peoriae]